MSQHLGILIFTLTSIFNLLPSCYMRQLKYFLFFNFLSYISDSWISLPFPQTIWDYVLTLATFSSSLYFLKSFVTESWPFNLHPYANVLFSSYQSREARFDRRILFSSISCPYSGFVNFFLQTSSLFTANCGTLWVRS